MTVRSQHSAHYEHQRVISEVVSVRSQRSIFKYLTKPDGLFTRENSDSETARPQKVQTKKLKN